MEDLTGTTSQLLEELEALRNRVAELERTEKELRQRQHFVQSVLNGLFAFAGVLTPDGILIEANRSALEAAGLKPEEVLDKPFEQAYWWSYSPQIQAQLRAAIRQAAQGEVVRYDVKVRLGEKLFIIIDFCLSPIFDEQGRVTFLVPSGVDITDRKQTEQQNSELLSRLMETEARYQNLFEGLADAVLVADAEARYLNVNAATTAMLGYSREELLQMRVPDVVNLQPEVTEQIFADYTRQGYWNGEIELRRKDGSTLLVECHASIINLPNTTLYVNVARDITGRRQAEEELRQSEARFRAVQDTNLDGFTVLRAIRDSSGQIEDFTWEYVNHVTEKMTGFHLSDLKNKRVLKLFPTTKTSGLFDIYCKVIETGKPFETELYYEGEGVKGWFRSVTVKLGDGVVVTHYDVTRRKETEQRLNFQAKILSQLYDSVIAIDNDQRVTYWNAGAERLYGVKAGEALGQPLNELYEFIWQKPEDEQQAYASLAANDYWQGENIHRTRKGQNIWVDSAVSVVRNEQNEPIGLLAVIRDISARKQAGARLAFLAEASATLAASLDYEATLQEVTRLAISYLCDYCLFDLLDEQNPQPFHRVAISHNDPVKEKLAREIDYRYPPNPQTNPLARVLDTGQPVLVTQWTDEMLQAQAHDAEHLRLLRDFNPQSGMSVPLIVREKVIGVLTFVSAGSGRRYDAEDLTLAEELARRAAIAIDNARLYQEAQKTLETQRDLDYLKDLFMSVASHELRTPLTAIKGYAQMMQRQLQKAPPDGQERRAGQERILRNVENIVRQSDRMNDMVNQLLDFSRLQNNKFELHYSPDSNLAELVERVVEQHRLTKTTDHNLMLELQANPIIATYDEARLEQVLDNLISNALKYSEPDTGVTVGLALLQNPASPGTANAASRPEVHAALSTLNGEFKSLNEDMALVWVKDQGYGIAEEEQPFIFDRFYRIRSTETSKADGLGLGLYVSHEIIHKHGGRMWLESHPGAGSTFYAAFPLHPSRL